MEKIRVRPLDSMNSKRPYKIPFSREKRIISSMSRLPGQRNLRCPYCINKESWPPLVGTAHAASGGQGHVVTSNLRDLVEVVVRAFRAVLHAVFHYRNEHRQLDLVILGPHGHFAGGSFDAQA